MDEKVIKWIFMMEYCRKNGWNPAESYYWNKAEEAYNQVMDNE